MAKTSLSKGNQITLAQSLFESIRQTRADGSEYWSAREYQQALEYGEWRNFHGVIKKAKDACKGVGHRDSDHFVGANKMVDLGSGSKRKLPDYELTRLACGLIAQNGDPRNPRIAEAQVYYAIQTHYAELVQRQDLDMQQRLELRGKTIDGNKALSTAAARAGVTNYSEFYNAGYEGQYGMRKRDLNRRRGIPAGDTPLNHMGAVELAANDFRILLTQESLRQNDIKGQGEACDIHFDVGSEVRQVMLRQGVVPEKLPVASNIRPTLDKERRRQKLLASGPTPGRIKG